MVSVDSLYSSLMATRMRHISPNMLSVKCCHLLSFCKEAWSLYFGQEMCYWADRILSSKYKYATVLVCRMPHRKWRATKRHPSRANSCQQLSCSLYFASISCEASCAQAEYTSHSAVSKHSVRFDLKRLFEATQQLRLLHFRTEVDSIS